MKVLFATLLTTVFVLLFFSSARAETFTASLYLTPEAEVSPPTPPPANANVGILVNINVTRDSSGNIISGAINMIGAVRFPGSVMITGLQIHEGGINEEGPSRFDAGIANLTFVNGTGFININFPTVDVTELQKLISKPTGYYINIRTAANPEGAVRGQILKLVETLANTVSLTTAAEVPPVTDATASGTATITINPNRDSKGVITGGSVNFTVACDIPANSNVTGLHIHEKPAGENGVIVIDSGINITNPVGFPTGKGMINITAPVNTAAGVEALKRLIANPAGFYVNLHTNTKPDGLMRGQMTSVLNPPMILQASTYAIPTGNSNVAVDMLVNQIVAIDVNGKQELTSVNLLTGATTVTIPGASLNNAGTLLLQARNAFGLSSSPIAIVVYSPSSLNSVAAVTVDAAKYGNTVSPESIGAMFGTRLASQTVLATTQPLPKSLDGTTVYVNGKPAGLFAVLQSQVNYLIPGETVVGPAQVVVSAKDGTVSLGNLKLSQDAPAIFTRKADGTGAPAAVGSVDGQNFSINLSNADGTPVTIDPGNFVALFGTGLRFATMPPSIDIGGINVSLLYAGPQGQLDGLDQVNLQIPQSLAGRGEVDLVLMVEGISSNKVRLKIR